jgi:uncharacterized membrane protein
MQSKVRLFGHPVHPMIVPFPIAFYTATLVSSIVYATNGDTFWFHVAFIANCAALVMAAVAVLPGLIDWLSIPELTDAKTTGLKHMVANVFTLGLFTANAAVVYPKLDDPHPTVQSSIMLTGFGFLIMLYAGFKGWKMVQTHHIGIDAPSDAEIPDEKSEVKNANEIFSETTATPKRGFAEQQQNEKTM